MSKSRPGYETDFAERMFVDYYRLFDRYRLPLASLVVLADDRPQWRPDRYERRLWGCELALKFPVVKLLDYQGQLAELEADPIPLPWRRRRICWRRRPRRSATAVGWQTGPDPAVVPAGLDQTGSSRPVRVHRLAAGPPEALEDAFLDEIHDLEESTKMRYISSAERIGMKRG